MTLRSYILYQHHHCQVTQPLLHEQLREWGIDISTGAIDAILTSDHDRFHAEKDALLERGLGSARYVTVDDSGARHQGRNGYVTQIGNAFFAWFCSTSSKSRINFLTLLCAGEVAYRINKYALAYMGEQGLPATPMQALVRGTEGVIEDAVGWEAHLDRLAIHLERHRRIATEGALLGTLAARGLTDLVVLSDDAGQFNVLQHPLCWIHSERLIHTMLPLNEDHRQDIERVRDQLWRLYAELKAYKLKPRRSQRPQLEQAFDALFTQKTRYQGLNELLKRPQLNLEAFKAEIARMLGADELLAGIGDWLGVLHYLARAAERHAGLAVVLDEFPYLADADPALPSVIQKFWDSGAARAGNLKLLLCGSIISQMQELLAERNPLYGRKTLALDLAPLPLQNAAQFVPRYPAEDRLATFGIFGGMPFYLQFLDPGARLQSNIVRLLLSATGSLVDEPMVLLQSELREVSRYASVLAAIAAGCTKHGEIIRRVREISDSKALGPYLEKLDRMRLVRIERSMDAKSISV